LADLGTPVKFTEADKIGGVAEVRRLPFTSPAVCGVECGLATVPLPGQNLTPISSVSLCSGASRPPKRVSFMMSIRLWP